MKQCAFLWFALVAASLAGCAQTGPVEFSPTGSDAPMTTRADDLDFGPMDHSIAVCKAAAYHAGAGRCVQVRTYEACMKARGYLTLLGPENPSGCAEPDWERDARKWLQ
jgi:predicted small lipoprotein YifL